MPELRSMMCDIEDCKKIQTEQNLGEGFSGWGKVQGVSLPENHMIDSVVLCPAHLRMVVDYLNTLKGDINGSTG